MAKHAHNTGAPLRAPSNRTPPAAIIAAMLIRHSGHEISEAIEIVSDLLDLTRAHLSFNSDGDEPNERYQRPSGSDCNQSRVVEVAANSSVLTKSVETNQSSTTLSAFRLAEGQYRAAVERFNNLPEDLERDDEAAFKREEAAFLATVDAVDSALPTDWNEFATAFEIACDEGQSLPSDHLVHKLLADVRRLSGEGPSE